MHSLSTRTLVAVFDVLAANGYHDVLCELNIQSDDKKVVSLVKPETLKILQK